MISIKLGTRPSILALKQVEELKNLLPQIAFDVVSIKTRGDKDKLTPLTLCENSNFFTHEIEQALLSGEIDIALHSAKDLPDEILEESVIIAKTKSISRFDCLVANGDFTLDSLPKNSFVGTSSKARSAGVLKYRPDLRIKDIRGNVDQRLEKLEDGEFDAIIVAQAALIRLGLENKISQVIPFNILEAHPLQGRLAIQVLKSRVDLKDTFSRLNHD